MSTPASLIPVTPVQPQASPASTHRLKELKKACEQFEAVFSKQLISEMRKGIKSSMGDQPGSAIYQDMMDQAIGDSMAHQGALGIGQLLYKQFAKQVSAGVQPAATNIPPVSGPIGTAATDEKKEK